MSRKYSSLTLLILLIVFYETYVIFTNSTMKKFLASYLRDSRQNEMNVDKKQSLSSSISWRKQTSNEWVHAIHYDHPLSSKVSDREPMYDSTGAHASNYEPFRRPDGKSSYEATTSTNKDVGYNTKVMENQRYDKDTTHREEIHVKDIKDKKVIQDDKTMKTIVWYDTQEQTMVRHSKKVNFTRCKYQNCRFQYIISAKDMKPREPFQADAVLVQGNAILSLSPPPRRDLDQVFVLGVRDAFPGAKQGYRNHIAQLWTRLFNWTMTYRHDSDIVYKYANIYERQHVINMTLPIEDKVLKRQLSYNISNKDYESVFNEKTGEAVWFVSHCTTKSRRESYVKELKKELDVKIYGFCGEKAPCPKGETSCFKDVALKYKFYLAFENTFYADYVSEKVFQWFDKDVIIVARGGSNYSKILPPGTVIDAGDFSSPRELGKYLKELAYDKERYIAHLKRKFNYVTTSVRIPLQVANCKLCEFLHTIDSHRKSYIDVFKWWLENHLSRRMTKPTI